MSALSPEVGREIPRTRVSLTSEGDEIILNVEASDLGALRAALNSYLRWISISEEIGNMVGEENG
jgi:KEOPS complex subunit Pcc1